MVEGEEKLDSEVLVVDENDAVRTAIGNVLRSTGYRVAEAENGSVALAHLRVGSVGAVVLDIHTTGLDGLGFLDRLDDPPPVVAVTGRPYNPDIASRSRKIFGFVESPVRVEQLLALVASALARSPSPDRARARGE